MKGKHFLDTSFVYKLLIAKNDQLTHEQQEQERKSQMKEMIESMNLLLEELRKYKSLDNKTINQLRLDVNQVQLPYAYFLPDISQVRSIRLTSRRIVVIFFSCSSLSIRKNRLSVIPMIVCKHGSTWKIGHLINDISTTICNQNSSTNFIS